MTLVPKGNLMTTEQSTFTDRHGKTWTITLDPVLLTQVKEHCGIKLTDLKADPFLRLSSDPELLIAVLWILCEEEAKTRTLDYLGFAKSITGDQLDGIVTALEVAVINFCPSSMKSTLKSLLKENAQTQKRAMEMTTETLTRNREKNAAAMASSAEKRINRLLESIEEPASAANESATSLTGSMQ